MGAEFMVSSLPPSLISGKLPLTLASHTECILQLTMNNISKHRFSQCMELICNWYVRIKLMLAVQGSVSFFRVGNMESPHIETD